MMMTTKSILFLFSSNRLLSFLLLFLLLCFSFLDGYDAYLVIGPFGTRIPSESFYPGHPLGISQRQQQQQQQRVVLVSSRSSVSSFSSSLSSHGKVKVVQQLNPRCKSSVVTLHLFNNVLSFVNKKNEVRIIISFLE
jgi:hypothetical protein